VTESFRGRADTGGHGVGRAAGRSFASSSARASA
jgi:hypothetical protein